MQLEDLQQASSFTEKKRCMYTAEHLRKEFPHLTETLAHSSGALFPKSGLNKNQNQAVDSNMFPSVIALYQLCLTKNLVQLYYNTSYSSFIYKCVSFDVYCFTIPSHLFFDQDT